jgi:hypothetical protein
MKKNSRRSGNLCRASRLARGVVTPDFRDAYLIVPCAVRYAANNRAFVDEITGTV